MKTRKRNFLEGRIRAKKASKKRKKILWYSLSITAGLCVAIGLLVLIYWDPAHELVAKATAGKDAFLEAEELLVDQDFSQAQTVLDEAIIHFQESQEIFKKFSWLQYIPWVGTQVRAVDNLFAVGISTGQSIKEVSATASSIVTPLTQNEEISLATLSEEQTHQLLEDIYNAKPKLEEAKVSIDEAVTYLDEIPNDRLIGKLRELIAPLKEQVPQLQDGLDQAISLSQILPLVAGYPEPKTYLFLLENNEELAPSGGFIGTYGILKISDGDITSFTTDNVYNLDEPAEAWLDVDAPWQVARYNAAPKLFLRGASWSPDFPTTGETAQWFYTQERGPEKNLDGTIAITPTFIESLLTLTGDISVGGLTFNSDNFIELLSEQVQRGFLRQGIPLSERKEIIGVLADKILDDILSLPKSQWPDLWKLIQQNIDQKHILIYSNDEYVQSMILKENWGGAIQDVDHDYLTVIDANLASLKTDPVVQRTIHYTVQRDRDNVIADVTIDYENTGTITWKTTRYRTYTRVYTPQGSTLLSNDGAMVDCKLSEEGSVETTEEYNKTVFGAFICIEPGEKKSLHYKYRLPDRIYDQFSAGTYTLLVQKQAGAKNHALFGQIDLKEIPDAVKPLDSTIQVEHTKALINTQLSQDLEYVITY